MFLSWGFICGVKKLTWLLATAIITTVNAIITATALGTTTEDGKQSLKKTRTREKLTSFRILLGAIVIGAFLIFVVFSYASEASDETT